MLFEELETYLVRSSVVIKAYSAVGSHYLRGTSGSIPKSSGGSVKLPPNKAVVHMFACENSYRRCSGKHGDPGVKALSPGKPDNDVHLTNASAYKWERTVVFQQVNLLHGESCVDRRHFDCVGFVRWCLKGINPGAGKYPSIRSYKKMCTAVSTSGVRPDDLCMGDLLFRRNFEHIGIAMGASTGLVVQAQQEDVGVVSGPVGSWEWHGRLPKEFWLGQALPKS